MPTQDGEHVPVKLRSYQYEMLEQSLECNVIVAMDTGSGKTHVAVMRIRSELGRLDSDKAAYHTKLLTGADDVEKWTTSDIWDAFLAGVHVVVSTPAILADALTHGFVAMRRLALCVFDECHHATKQHPMNRIMRDFYHPAKASGNHVPRILGLSASPVISTKANSVEAIESNLDARTITPKQHRNELLRHVHLPRMIRTTYEQAELPADSATAPTYAALLLALRTYDIVNDPYVLELRERNDEKSTRLLCKAIETRKTYCIEQLQVIVNRAGVIHEQLGSSMAEWYAATCCTRFLESSTSDNMVLFDLKEKEAMHLRAVLQSARDRAATPRDPATCATTQLSSKAKALVQIINEHATPDSRLLVFVQQRATVSAVAYLLRSTTRLSTLSFGTFSGTSVSAKRMNLVADLIDPKAQMNDLQDFRDGSKNVMISTDVLEEGIDVPALNGVICFDLPTNLVSFVQRRGRARQPDSKYVLFVPESDVSKDPGGWQMLEDRMKEAYSDDSRGEPESPAEDEDDLSALKYRVPSTGALLTAHNAKAHLHHFSAVSTTNVSRYIDPRPEFDLKQHATEKTWSATVTLPSFIHPTLRNTRSLSRWRSEGAAVKDAAFRAYSTLHQAGLVNDNLLPPPREQTPESGETHVDQPALVQVLERVDVWKILAHAASEQNAGWCAAELTLKHDGSLYYTTRIWLPVEVPTIENTALYWNSTTTYVANIRPLPDVNTPSAQDLLLLARATQLILSSAFGSRMPDDRSDFAVLVQPGDVGAWLQSCSGLQSARDRLGNPSHTREDLSPCIVHVEGQMHRPYVLHGLSSSSVDNTSTPESCLLVRPFTRRRDFLHLIPSEEVEITAASNAATQAVPVSLCTIADLPLCHSVFAALLPSILHVVDFTLLAQRLRSNELATVSLQSTDVVIEAISAPVARERSDYDRLEYLGDAMLKICTELQLYAQYPLWPEARLSAEKDRIVRNSNLARAAIANGLDGYILTEPFTGAKWRLPYISELLARTMDGRREMSSKVLADVVESLVGAAYVDGGLENAYRCIRTLLPQETWWDLDVILRSIHSDMPASHTIAGLEPLEALVGHTFANKSLLIEATTHASYPQNTTGMSYERLEFLGDAVLDFIITPKLFAHPRKLRHWELHRVHEALVNAHFLGYCCMTLSTRVKTYDVRSVSASKHSPVEVVPAGRALHLYDFLRGSGELNNVKRDALKRFDTLQARISSALAKSSLYPWPDLLALRPDKAISDIVEALLGALYLDTRGDLSVCESFLEQLGVLPAMRRMLDHAVETAHPRERLGILADQDEVNYSVSRGGESVKTWSCTVNVGKSNVTRVDQCGSREEAEARAAEAAVETLENDLERRMVRKRRKLVLNVDAAMGGAESEKS